MTIPLDLKLDELIVKQLNETECDAVLRLAQQVLDYRLRRGECLTCPKATQQYLKVRLGAYRNEVFGCIFLDTRHRIIETEELFKGTIDGACVYPRVVAQRALAHNAAALVLFHNHPSGVAEPSLADQQITRRLREALALIDVRVIDHFVVSASESVSMAERGLI